MVDEDATRRVRWRRVRSCLSNGYRWVIRLLAQPSGRRPRRDIADLSAWYNELDERDQDGVREVVRLAVDQAVFGMLAALDGSRSLGTGVELSLRDGNLDLMADHDLHDIFRNRVDQELGYDLLLELIEGFAVPELQSGSVFTNVVAVEVRYSRPRRRTGPK